MIAQLSDQPGSFSHGFGDHSPTCFELQVLVGKGAGAVVAGETPDMYPDALIVKLSNDLQLTWYTAVSATGAQTVDELVVNATAVFVLGTAWSADPINITTLQQAGQSSQSVTAFVSQVSFTSQMIQALAAV